ANAIVARCATLVVPPFPIASALPVGVADAGPGAAAGFASPTASAIPTFTIAAICTIFTCALPLARATAVCEMAFFDASATAVGFLALAGVLGRCGCGRSGRDEAFDAPGSWWWWGRLVPSWR